MSEINCNACSELKETSPSFVQNGIGDTECTSLAADTGLNPSISPNHNDATDLHNMNDCLVGRMDGELEEYEVCDWQDFMHLFIPNLYELLKGIICALGGIWTFIHNLLSRVGSLETRMTNVEGRVTTLEGDVSNLKGRMTTAEGNISNLQGRMTTAEGTLSNHTTAINNLNTTVAGHTTSINNLNSSVGAINNKIDEIIAAMGGSATTIPVMKRFRYTVPASKFSKIWRADSGAVYDPYTDTWLTISGGIMEWMSGGGQGDDQDPGEGIWIRIPTTDMSNINGVWAQTWVVPGGNPYDGVGKPYVQTVNVQEWYEDGNYLVVNFDAFIVGPEATSAQNGAPYPVTIDFLVIGERTINA